MTGNRSRYNLFRAAVISCAGVAALGVHPATAGKFDAEYVFGDSLSDRGNLAELEYVLHGYPNFPYPPSNHSSFTNGPVAVQLLAQSFGTNANPSLWVTGFQDPANFFGGPSFVPGTNYAVAGATAALAATGGPTGINLPEQVGAYEGFAGAADPAALYVIMIGGNDVRNAALQGTGDAAVDAGVAAELAAIKSLSTDGAKNFLIVNVPNVGIIPEFAQQNPTLAGTATTLSQYYDTELAEGLQTLDPTLAAGTLVSEFNLYAFNTELLANAASYGFTNTTDPCFNDTPYLATSSSGCSLANISNFIYWDDIHPTGNVQALWAEGFEAAVPEPSTWAMMVLGFAALGVLGYRSSRKAAAITA